MRPHCALYIRLGEALGCVAHASSPSCDCRLEWLSHCSRIRVCYGGTSLAMHHRASRHGSFRISLLGVALSKVAKVTGDAIVRIIVPRHGEVLRGAALMVRLVSENKRRSWSLLFLRTSTRGLKSNSLFPYSVEKIFQEFLSSCSFKRLSFGKWLRNLSLDHFLLLLYIAGWE